MKPLLFILPLLLSACSHTEHPNSETRPVGRNTLSALALKTARSGPVDFAEHIKPIFEAKCAMCHNRSALPGRMSLANKEQAQATGTLGTFIIPGQPEQSLLANNLGAAHASIKAMPPVGERVTRDELSVLRKWIQEGADWPEGPSGEVATSL